MSGQILRQKRSNELSRLALNARLCEKSDVRKECIIDFFWNAYSDILGGNVWRYKKIRVLLCRKFEN
jgi:hypothetical protein